MNEDFIEYDCFISMENSKDLQLLNNSGLNLYDLSRVTSSNYKYQIPEIEMKTDIPAFNNFRKSGFENTNTRIKTLFDESASSNKKFGVYFEGKNAHFVPVSRPILKTYTLSVEEVEYKKANRRENNLTTESKINLDDFYASCPGGLIKPLTISEKIRQQFIQAKYVPFNKDLTELRCRTLSCYSQVELTDIKFCDDVLKNINKVTNEKKCTSMVPRRNHITNFLESEVLNIMLQIKVEKFSEIMKLLKDRNTSFYDDSIEKNVLKYLNTISLMIRGLWVIKSEVLYRMDTVECSLPANMMTLVRDYVLCLFHAGIETTPTKIKSVTKISAIEAGEVLKQFATPITNNISGKNEFKYYDIHYESINKYQEINEEHNRIMHAKSEEVCSIFNLDSLLADSCSSKRKRSYSQQYETDSLNRRDSIDTGPIAKRARVSSERISLTNYESIAITTTVPGPFFFDSEEIADDMERIAAHMKEEPLTSYDDSHHTDASVPLIKAELSEINSVEENDLDISSKFPQCFPSMNLYQNIKTFIEKQFDFYDIMPVNELAIMFFENNLSIRPSQWENLVTEEVIEQLKLCICAFMDKCNSKKIDIEWPQISSALSKQILYLSNSKSVLTDEKFLNKLLELMKSNGSTNLTELKKVLLTDKETKYIFNSSSNLLRDRVKKYCHYRHRKFFLKFTVAERV